MSLRYAAGTTVTASQTQGEITRLLTKVGVDRIASMMEPSKHVVYFELNGRGFRFTLPLPDPESEEFTMSSRGRRTSSAAEDLYEKEVNRRWRSFGNLIKATLVAVEDGILDLQEALAPYALLPNRNTMAEEAAARMKELPNSPMQLPWRTE